MWRRKVECWRRVGWEWILERGCDGGQWLPSLALIVGAHVTPSVVTSLHSLRLNVVEGEDVGLGLDTETGSCCT